MHSRRLSGEEGQAIIFVIVVVPLLLGIAALVIDGTHLFGKRRALQNAADASALAAAREIDPFGSPCSLLIGCDANVTAKIQQYSGANGGPSTGIHACASSSDTNCYQNPYKGDTSLIQVRLSQLVTDPFGKLASSIGVKNLKASASAVGRVTAGGVPDVMYAMNAQNNSTGNECKGISVQGSNNSFTATWSNGYYETGTGGATNNTAPTALYGAQGSCNPLFFAPANNPNFGVPQRLQVPKRCDTCWPKAIPDVAAICASAPSANVQNQWNIGTNGQPNWTASHAPGIYCANGNGVGGGGGISINAFLSPTDLRGYTFISINGTVTTTAAGVQFAPATGASNVTFYAGGNSGVTIGSSASWAGDVFAPSGSISFTANSSNIPFTGFLEGDSISVQANGVNFIGSGPVVGNPSVGLTE